MSSLALNSDNDFHFEKGKLVFISGYNTDDEIIQRLRMRFKFFKGEWFLNSEHGLPYFEEILGTKNLDSNIIESVLRKEVLSVEGIREITKSSIDYDAENRKIKYTISVVSINSESPLSLEFNI